MSGTPELWGYRARVVRVVDGDTLDLDIDLGFGVRYRPDGYVRLAGIDTPEIYGVSHESEEYAAGQKASEFALKWVSDQKGEVLIRSHDGKGFQSGKYGRWIVEVFPAGGSGESLNEALVGAGLADRL